LDKFKQLSIIHGEGSGLFTGGGAAS